MAMIREGLQRKRDSKADCKMTGHQEISALINQSRSQVMTQASPVNMCSDENTQQALTAYLKQQKHLRTKEKMRNVRIWKK